jgi:hypothetical protein
MKRHGVDNAGFVRQQRFYPVQGTFKSAELLVTEICTAARRGPASTPSGSITERRSRSASAFRSDLVHFSREHGTI